MKFSSINTYQIYIAVDLSGNFEEMKRKLDVSEEEMGPVYMLVNNAGTSFCGKLEDLKDTDIQVRCCFGIF
jgi:short-subunit dehydrogenase